MNVSKACVFSIFALVGFCAASIAQTDLDLEKVKSATNSAERNRAVRELLHRGKPPTLAERLSQDDEATYKAAALVGVDALGRLAMATDADLDGIADVYFLLVAKERLPGPWTRHIQRARVHYKSGSVSIESMDKDYALIATGAGMKALRVRPDKYSELYELKDAEEFTVNFGGAGTTNALSMATISHEDIESWPVAFWLDTVQPGTGTVTCPDCSFSGIFLREHRASNA